MRLIELFENQDQQAVIDDFLEFAKKELNLSKLPNIQLIKNHISTKQTNSFASYSPSEKIIQVFVKNRHVMDILRSMAHELVHYKQDIEERLRPDSGKTGSVEENEANSLAGQLMRKYGKQHPELF